MARTRKYNSSRKVKNQRRMKKRISRKVRGGEDKWTLCEDEGCLKIPGRKYKQGEKYLGKFEKNYKGDVPYEAGDIDQSAYKFDHGSVEYGKYPKQNFADYNIYWTPTILSKMPKLF